MYDLQHRNKRKSQESKAILKHQLQSLDDLFKLQMWVFDLHFSHERIKHLIKRKQQKLPILDLIAYNIPQVYLYWIMEINRWNRQTVLEALYINEVTYAYAASDYAKALRIANNKLQKNPEDAVSLLYKGLILADSLNKPQIIEEYTTRALVMNPDLHDAYYYRAVYYEGVKKYDLARQDIDMALLYRSDSPKYLYQSSAIYAKIKQWEEAEKVLDYILHIDDKYVNAYLSKGAIHLFKDNYDLALIDYNKAVQLGSNDDETYAVRAIIYTKLGKYSKALADYTKAIAVSKHNKRRLYLARAEAYRTIDKPALALRDYDSVIALDSTYFPPVEGKAFTYLMLKKYDKALEMLKLVMTKKISNRRRIYTYNNIGHTYYKMGDYAKALKNINYSLSQDDKNAYAYKNRALVYITQGKKALACADLAKAEALGYTKKYDNEVQELKQKHCK